MKEAFLMCTQLKTRVLELQLGLYKSCQEHRPFPSCGPAIFHAASFVRLEQRGRSMEECAWEGNMGNMVRLRGAHNTVSPIPLAGT